MATVPVRKYVDTFFWSVDPRGSCLQTAERVAAVVAGDPKAQESFRAVQGWVTRQMEALPRQMPPRGLGSPAELTLLAVTYLGVVEWGRAAGPARVPEITASYLAQAAASLERLEPEVVPTLLEETERRAGRDPVFARKLQEATADVRWVISQLPPIPGGEPQRSGSIARLAADDNGWGLGIAVLVLGGAVAWLIGVFFGDC